MSEAHSLAVETRLSGYFRSDYENPSKTVIDVMGQTPTDGVIAPTAATINDGRELQGLESDGTQDFESRFFQKHGFVLLPHKSRVENWDSGAFGASDALPGSRDTTEFRGENEIETKYMAEVEDIIRTKILPGRKLKINQPNMVLRRGKDTAHPFFGIGIHNDYGISKKHFADNTAAFQNDEAATFWTQVYEQDHVEAFMVINFWRTVHMAEPLTHMPLAVLDANSVTRDDLVVSGLRGFTQSGRITTQLSLRYNQDQRWYYYPEMSVDEVLVLNLFHIRKDDPTLRFGACYHSAFENPLTPPNAQERQSCEHRVNVFVLKD